MSKPYYDKEFYEDLYDCVENEGIGYYIEHYTSGEYFKEDLELYAAFKKAQEGICEFRKIHGSRLEFFGSDYANEF